MHTLSDPDRRRLIRQAADLVGGGHALARMLAVTPRTVQAWLAGDRTPRDGVMADLARVLAAHGDKCRALAAEITATAAA